ncbi:glucosamine--fructose-6-phosphate aminotransferase, partial [Haemophilus influenzae]
LMMVL